MNKQHQKKSDRQQGEPPRLSLCMIVKNEEALLGQCLESVKSLVDEMIVVDTGSTDRTVDIAKSYGARVYHHPWQGSFSEARNYGLQFASGDWILQMDADEALEQEDIHIVKKVIQSGLYDAVYVALLSETEDGWGKHYFQRIFRRGKAHYEGIVHNQLKYKGASLNTEIRIYHWGYNLSKEKMQAKFKRTESLLLKQIEEDRSNPFAHHNYLRILRAQERYEDGVEVGKKALLVCKHRMSEHHRQMITYDTAHCCMLVGAHREAESLCRDILDEYPSNLDCLFTLACVQTCQKRYQDAIDTFHRFLSAQKNHKEKPENNMLIVDSYTFDHRAWDNIAKNLLQLGKNEEALEAAGKALDIRPDKAVYDLTLAEALYKLGRRNEARDHLQTVESEKKALPDFYIKWAMLSRRYPELGSPEKILGRGVRTFPDNDEVHNSLAYALFEHDPGEAEEAWHRALQHNPNHVGAKVGLAKLYAHGGKSEDLERTVDDISKASNNREVLKMVGGYCLHAQRYAKAIEVFSRYMTLNPEDTEVLSDVATCYAKLGQYEAALVGYREALRLDSHNPTILKNIKALQRLILNTGNQ